LLEILLAEPDLVGRAVAEVPVEEVAHPGLRRLLAGLYQLHATGEPPTLDRLRMDMDDNAPLVSKAFQLLEAGKARPNRLLELTGLVARFRQRREKLIREELRNQLSAVQDEQAGLELLRQLQNGTVELGPDTASGGDAGANPLSPTA